MLKSLHTAVSRAQPGAALGRAPCWAPLSGSAPARQAALPEGTPAPGGTPPAALPPCRQRIAVRLCPTTPPHDTAWASVRAVRAQFSPAEGYISRMIAL